MTTADEIKLPLTSRDVNSARLDRLRELFPEAFTEGKIDFEKLRQLLGTGVTDAPERYGLSWSGKSEAIKNIQTLTTATLLPARDESVNFDTTENLIIEGDNLEVLKLLQGGYHGRVKMIYIDPPYNTGGDFIYPDNYKEGLADYLKFSGQVSGEGVKLTTNPETDGRYHSKWLTMMYPRLFLARNLLREDGVIFVSIDDTELDNLKKLGVRFSEKKISSARSFGSTVFNRRVTQVNSPFTITTFSVSENRTTSSLPILSARMSTTRTTRIPIMIRKDLGVQVMCETRSIVPISSMTLRRHRAN